MLYDNALLIEALTHAWQRTGNRLFEERIAETIDWLKAEMVTADGAFAASLDADSEGEEGRFYVWHRSEVESILGDDAGFFCEAYDITADGNWARVSIPNRSRRPGPHAPEYEARLRACRLRLLAERGRRVRPGLDDKILADWNGLAIAAIARAAAVFAKPEWLDLARNAYAFIRSDMSRDDRLGHAWRAGRLVYPGLSSDHAAMARAAIALFETTTEPDYLTDARTWISALEAHHRAASGGYYLAADDADDILVRMLSPADDAVPNPNAVAADCLVRLWLLTGDDSYRDAADSILAAFSGTIASNPTSTLGLVNVLDFLLDPVTVVIVGALEQRAELRAACHSLSLWSAVLFETESTADLPVDHPAHGKQSTDGNAAAFVCRAGTCSLPIADPADLVAMFPNLARQPR
ncbi:MAG: hypothetical protein R3D02_07910 [Hyphomicrobiales bacterium]